MEKASSDPNIIGQLGVPGYLLQFLTYALTALCGDKCFRKREGKMTASGSTFNTQSWLRYRNSLPIAFQAFTKISVFAAVPSLEIPTLSGGMGRLQIGPKGPSPSRNFWSATTENSSQGKMPASLIRWALNKPTS